MKLLKPILIAALAMTTVFALALPRNSYLVRPAKTKEALISQARGEEVLMDRYMRHFSMSREEVLSFLQTLHLGRLEKTGIYLVYGVPKNGVIHATPQNLRKGALVWLDEMSQPILLEVCGNPMTPGPKRATMSDAIQTQPSAAPQGIVAISTMSTTPMVSQPMTVSMVPATPTTPTVIEPGTESPVIQRGGNAGIAALLLPAALALRSTDNRDPVVPEPASMLALSVGLAGIAARRRAKKN